MIKKGLKFRSAVMLCISILGKTNLCAKVKEMKRKVYGGITNKLL